MANIEGGQPGGNDDHFDKASEYEELSATESAGSSPEVLREEAGFSVSFDRAKLTDLAERAPGQARDVVESLLKMPERLEFKPGITLIVGKNGSGKSAISKAIYLRRQLDERARRSKDYEDEGGDEALSDLEALRRGGGSDWGMVISGGPLVAELVGAIKIDQLDDDARGYAEYINYGSLHGRGTDALAEQERYSVAGSMGVDSEGRSIAIAGRGYSDVPRFSEATEGDDSSYFGGRMNRHMSSRQYMDDALEDRARSRARIMDKNSLIVADEPEVGIDPRRQRTELRALVQRDIGEGAGIVPTNSIALFEDLEIPRIDLQFPEKGVHLASREEIEMPPADQ